MSTLDSNQNKEQMEFQQKRPVSHHISPQEISDMQPIIQTIKIGKNNPLFQKKVFL